MFAQSGQIKNQIDDKQLQMLLKKIIPKKHDIKKWKHLENTYESLIEICKLTGCGLKSYNIKGKLIRPPLKIESLYTK